MNRPYELTRHKTRRRGNGKISCVLFAIFMVWIAYMCLLVVSRTAHASHHPQSQISLGSAHSDVRDEYWYVFVLMTEGN